MITAEQMRAARALIRMEQATLAEISGVSLPTIKRLETTTGVLRAQEATLESIVGALQRCGVVFIGDKEHSPPGGAGIRLARSREADDWNRKLDEVLSSISLELTKYQYEKAAQNYKTAVGGAEYVKAEDLPAFVRDLLENVEDRLTRTPVPGGDLFDQNKDDE